MDAAQAGMLAGIRPMIEYLATPFWNKIANRFQKGKMMLLIAVASWIIFTLPIGFIHPPGMHTRTFFQLSAAHLTVSLYLCSSRSNARGESRALEGRRVSSKSTSRVRDGDEGAAGMNERE